AARKARRHVRLRDLGRAADWTGDEAALGLLVIGRRAGEPALEVVLALAYERIADHEPLPTACRKAGSAAGVTTSNRRPCCSDGMRVRAVTMSAGAISAITTQGSSPPSATIRPQGATTSALPKVSRPISCPPPCAAATTEQGFPLERP